MMRSALGAKTPPWLPLRVHIDHPHHTVIWPPPAHSGMCTCSLIGSAEYSLQHFFMLNLVPIVLDGEIWEVGVPGSGACGAGPGFQPVFGMGSRILSPARPMNTKPRPSPAKPIANGPRPIKFYVYQAINMPILWKVE